MNKTAAAENTDAYIEQFPSEVQALLQQLRTTIKTAAPQAEEVISYQMPAYKYHGMLIYFAGYKNHIGLYPGAAAIVFFKKDITKYKTTKGAIQFPLAQPLPLSLVTKIVQFRIKENEKVLPKKSVLPKAKTKKPTDDEQVDEWLDKQEPSVKEEINAIRTIIKKASPNLSERIKWNAPSYHCNQVDILTFGPYKKDKILLVFHHPYVVKITSPLLEGDYKDRRLLYFKNKAEAKKNKKELTRIITEIVNQIVMPE